MSEFISLAMGADNSVIMLTPVATSCHGCKYVGNKQTDTVTVDVRRVQQISSKEGNDSQGSGDKENSDPGGPPMVCGTSNAEKEKQRADLEREAAAMRKREAEQREEELVRRMEEKRRRLAQEEEERQRQLEEHCRQAAEEEEAQQAKEEEARRIAEEMIRRQRQAEAEETRCRVAEEAWRREEEAALRRERQREEEGALRRRQDGEEARFKEERLRLLLERARFQTPTEKKVTKGMLLMSSGFSYPLQAAVEANDAEFVELLLWAGADPRLANSKKQTPLQLAHAKNSKQGSHAKVIAALSESV